MRDVARLAGVSPQTVSRVVNGQPRVREMTRRRVLDAMQSLNYRRNFAARNLVTRRSLRLVGVLARETTLFSSASTLHGIENEAEKYGYLLSFATVREMTPDRALEAMNRLAHHGVDGVLVIAGTEAVTQALERAPHGLRFVAVGGARPAGGTPHAGVDNVAGARMATRHLLELGHRTVHHVPGPPGWPEAHERWAGWRRTLTAAGRVVPPVVGAAWDAASGYRLGRRLAADPAVTAILCANDRVALGVLRALHEAGRPAPDEVSVVGFDDTPEAAYFHPPLTTIRQDAGELGRRSLGMLLDHLAAPANESVPAGLTVASELVIRASTGRHRDFP